jgi:hypothetical protein
MARAGSVSRTLTRSTETIGSQGEATMVKVTLETIDGKLVACAVMVTVFPFGTAEGAVYSAMYPAEG